MGSLQARFPFLSFCLGCCSDKDVLIGSSQVCSPQHKPQQLELHPGQQSTNGNFCCSQSHFVESTLHSVCTISRE